MSHLVMKTSSPIFRVFAIAGMALLSSMGANAQVLMFDFGPTTVSGTDQTNSPYHTVNGSFTDTTWNKIQTADSSSLEWSDSGTATGVSINLGATTAFDSTTIGLNNQPSGTNALGNSTNTGVYAGTSVGKDGIYTGSSGNTRYVGFQIGGLSAGTYDVYVTSRNTNTGSTYNQHLYLGASSAAGDFDAVTLSLSGVLTYADGSTAISSWVEGANYLKFTVTLGAAQYLNFGVVGTGGELRGFLNSVQIVTVPEPSSVVLLLGGLGLLAARRRR